MKNIILLIPIFLLALFASPQTYASAQIKTKAQQAILVDYDTGMVLFEKDSHKQMPTSSMSKVMSMYVVFEALKNKQIDLQDYMQVSEKAWRKGGSKMFVEIHGRIKIEDLLRGVIIQSGNDATIVLAEGLSGTEKAFAAALTSKAKELGMNNSNFVNASGWPDQNHYSTAKDLSTLAIALIKNFPEYYSYFSEREFTYNNITQKNRNPLLYRGIGADGIKTGHTEIGGYGLIGSAAKNGRRVILVANGMSSEKERAQESAKLLEWGLRGFKNQKLFTANKVIEHAQVIMGEENNVPLILESDIITTIPSLAQNDIKISIIYNGPLQAPIEEGEQIATLIIDIPNLPTQEHPLYAQKSVEPLGFFAAIFAKTKILLQGKTRTE